MFSQPGEQWANTGRRRQPRHHLSFQNYDQEDDQARRERRSNEPDRHHRGRIVREAARAEPAPVRIVRCLRQRSDARSWRRTLHGTAYSYEADYLLLNVPAGRMGAFSEDPEHFLTWNRDRGAHADPWDFLPRRLYRDYILALMREALRERAGASVER